MRDDPDDRGVGWTTEQVVAWTPPTKDVQVGYYEAIKDATRTYLSSLRHSTEIISRFISA